MKLQEIVLTESIRELSWNFNPDIGWWEDTIPLVLYHGTHIDNVQAISQSKLVPPESGYTAGWVSLALEPNTAFGYASMGGGESTFRSSPRPKHVPDNERAVLVYSFPGGSDEVRSMGMGPLRGSVAEQRDKLLNEDRYWRAKEEGTPDHVYYALAELRLPEVDSRYLIGYMRK